MFQKKFLHTFFILQLITTGFAITARSEESVGYLKDYDFQVTDVAEKGLKAKNLRNNMEIDWMNLKDSICSNRALVWAYDLFKNNRINPGKIFVFFTADVWEGEDKGYMYHAGTYVVENGKELVLEGSYAGEAASAKPMSIVDWISNETEGRVSGKKCIEIDKSDKDLTAYFYERYNLPRVRGGGKKGAPCYYRKAPGYVAYPATLAAMDLDGEKVTQYDREEVQDACVDSYAGFNVFKRPKAKRFCKDLFGF